MSAPEIDRLFFALWPDEATRTALAGNGAYLKQKLHPVGRWVGAHRYHLTLHFLGDWPALPESLAQRAREAAATVRSPCFELLIDEAGSFPNRSIPWWLGTSQPSTPLRHLWRALRDALLAHKVVYDAKLRLSPHVTVLRDATQILPVTPVPPVRWNVDRFALVHSHLGADSRYTVLDTWPLAETSPQEPSTVQRSLFD